MDASLLILAGAAAVVTGALTRILRKPVSSVDREKARRLYVNRHARMTDGSIIDIDGDLILYSYSVRGVGYTSSQDVSTLLDYMPADRAVLVGPVTVKYSLDNPADSILLCEEWSGLTPRYQTGRK